MEWILSVISIALGAAGLVYAFFTNREKAKLEAMVRISLSVTAGNIIKIRESAQLSWTNFDAIRKHTSNFPNSEDKKRILENAQRGTGDATAAERMLTNLLNEVLATQESLCGTRKIQHPE